MIISNRYPLMVEMVDDVNNREDDGDEDDQSHKKRKLSGKQDFCRKNFPDKARKSRQFSNSRQMRIKGGFARFCALAWSKYAP